MTGVRRRRGPLLPIVVLMLAAVLVIAVTGVVAGMRTADGVDQLALAPEVRSEVLREAREFWDNPAERLGFLSMAITDVYGRNICLHYVVTAYTLFGLPASRVDINCHQTATRLDP